MNQRVEIVRRRMNIDFDSAGAEGWHLRKKNVEGFLNAISFFLPPGEKYFVRSVQDYLPKITDPVLKEQARRFIYQEAMHSKEHERCNEVLGKTYRHGDKIEKFVAFCLMVNRYTTPKASQLAFTCALEHFTAMLGDVILTRQQSFLAHTHPAFATLWMWHAVEETEHKAVAFDVYQHCVGKGFFAYLLRIFMMLLATIGFFVAVAVGLGVTKLSKLITRKRHPAKAARKLKTTEKSPILLPVLKKILFLQQYLDYYKPSFHPWNHDNAHLIDEWKQHHQNLDERHYPQSATLAPTEPGSGLPEREQVVVKQPA